MNKLVGLIQVFQILIHTPEICLDRCISIFNRIAPVSENYVVTVHESLPTKKLIVYICCQGTN